MTVSFMSANYVAREVGYAMHGWGHGDDEIISREQAIEWFDLAHVGKSPSRFDFKKLENLNGHYIREAEDARLTDLVLPSLGSAADRTLLERAGVGLDDTPAKLGGATVADVVLEPTAIYARAVAELTRTVDVRGMAHITGGGIPGNLARQFPAGLGAEIDTGSWERLPVFGWLASLGVEDDEMWRVFNMGLGFACVVVPESAEVALTALERGGTPGFVAGRVVEGEGVTLR